MDMSQTPVRRHAARMLLVATGLGLTLGSGAALAGREWSTPIVGLLGVMIVVLVVWRQFAAVVRSEAAARGLEAEVAATTHHLQENEVRFSALVQGSSDVITILDRFGAVRYQSPSVERVFGYTPDDFNGRTVWELAHPEDVPKVQALLEQAIKQPEKSLMLEWRFRKSGGNWASCESLVRSMLEEPSVAGLVLNTRDVTDRKALEDQLVQDALCDPLTGLANRALIRDRINHRLAQLRRDGRWLAVILIDLDDFKAINDGLGHAAGDDVLCVVARRLSQAVRPGDTVARLGGDEFAVLVDDAPHSVVETIAGRIQELLRAPLLITGHEVFTPASIGVANADARCSDADDLLRNADVAMYTAKGRGKNQRAWFEADMHSAMKTRLTLATELRRAVGEQQFEVRYQPLVDLRTERISGFEALVRWRHPERGILMPIDFIPVAESTGVIVPLGRWVLAEACSALAQWQGLQHPGDLPLSVTVNLSARQFQEPTLMDDVAQVLRDTGVNPACVVLELTETVLMDDVEEGIEILRRLKGLGVRLALDDFGTGYSSLSYLRRFPIDMLKIDRSFVSALDTDVGPGMVRSILRLGETFRLVTVAEGIEDSTQLQQLRALGCTYGQGFLFSEPKDRSKITEMIARDVNLFPERVPQASLDLRVG